MAAVVSASPRTDVEELGARTIAGLAKIMASLRVRLTRGLDASVAEARVRSAVEPWQLTTAS